MILTFISLVLVSTAQGLIGYDCGAQSLNVTTLSLMDVGECDISQNKIDIEQKYVQLLQINEFFHTMIRQCKLEMHRTVYYCGMHSHISIVSNGESEYIYETTRSLCEDLHRTGQLDLGQNHRITGIRTNSSTTRSITYAGSISNNGKCSGVSYSDPYGSWEDAVVQGTLTITLQEYLASVSLSNDKIYLRSGTTCSLSSGTCVDIEGGHSFWDQLPIDNCKFHQYGVLYEGYADKMIDNELVNPQTVYSLSTQDITFALTAKNKEAICGYEIIRTEHPKLVIFETKKGETFAVGQKLSTSNLDMFAYINSKFVYVEKHVRTQMKNLYRDVITQRCNLERQTLKNGLTIATQAPDDFAYHLMKGPGYMAVVAGEVVHIVKCIPVEVKIEHAETCYAELQVTRNNKTYYLTPRTHILKGRGTQIPCNALLPSYYLLGESWYKILPRPTETLAPITIQPMTKPTWKYINPAELATSGIYTEKDLEELKDRVMFPVERGSLLNDVAREMHGLPVAYNDGAILKLLNDNAVEKIVANTWDKLWIKFMTFGTFSAGFIAILIIMKAIKTLVNIIIRGYALHDAFGWSFRILGAIWGTLATLLLYFYKRTEPTPTEGETKEGPRETAPSEHELLDQAPSTSYRDTNNKSDKCFYPRLM